MELFTAGICFLLGLVLIVKGGDWFLDGAVWIAEVSGVPRFIVGATVVSLATTLPELTVSITGVLEGEVDLAIGNAVGSVTANLGLIMGISLVCIPSPVDRRQFPAKAVLMLTGAAALTILCRGGALPLGQGLILLAVFALYLANNLRDAARSRAAADAPRRVKCSRCQAALRLGMFAAGLAGIIVGSQLLVDHGSRLALALGVPASVIGVTLVAVGTSLPELVTTLTAIVKKEASMSIGNIVGANVIDLTLILPVCAALSDGGSLAIGRQTNVLDLPACLLAGAISMLPPLATGRFYRWQGFALLGGYAVYLMLLLR